MKKKLLLFLLFVMTIFAGCQKIETYENGVPTYFLEPDGYIIAEITLDDSGFVISHLLYGYISEEDYQLYLNGNTDGVIIVKHPYENGREVSTHIREISNIEIGIYKDKRYN